MLVVLFCAAIAAMRLWPQTPAGRFLRRWMVEAPARRLTPGVMILAAFVVVVALATILLADRDVFFVVGSSLTEGIGWFAAFDIATYVDVLAVAWLLAATVRLRAARDAGKALGVRVTVIPRRWIGALRARCRAVRPGRRRIRPSADDGPRWAAPGLAFA